MIAWITKLFQRPATAEAAPVVSAPERRYYQQTNKRTPNVSQGRIIKPQLIVLHHSGGSYVGSVAWCCNPKSRVSYHCIIARNGKRTVLATPTTRTWHAGKSSWHGRGDVNSRAIGLAWEGDTYATPLSDDAILSAVEYLIPIIEDYEIDLDDIVRHADVAPGRKNDCSPDAHRALVSALVKFF